MTDIVESDGLVETKNSYGGSLLKGGTVVSKTENGIQVLYKFMEENTPFRWSTFCEDGFRARCFATKSWNRGTERVYQVSVLPFLAQGQPRTGTVFTGADGSGAVMRFDAKRTDYPSYTARLYGNDYLTVEDYAGNRQENCLLPFIGLQGQSNGFLAMADNGAAYASVYAERAGQTTDYNPLISVFIPAVSRYLSLEIQRLLPQKQYMFMNRAQLQLEPSVSDTFCPTLDPPKVWEKWRRSAGI